VIIVDSTDPQRPGKILFTAEKAAVSYRRPAGISWA
jgi:spermidine synthase